MREGRTGASHHGGDDREGITLQTQGCFSGYDEQGNGIDTAAVSAFKPRF